MKISVCIPMYNEKRIIASTARTLSEYMSSHFCDYEILFCSDGSTDGCDRAVEELCLPCVRVISYQPNRGKGYAVRTAMLEAKGDVRIFTDADLAYGTDVIGRIVTAFTEHPDADMVFGSRNLDKDGYEGYTLVRKLASKAYLRLLSLAGGFRLSDSQCGCKAFSGAAAEKIFSRLEVNGFAFDFEAILWAMKMKMKICEIPVKVINHGESKVRLLRDSLRMMKDLRKMRKRIRKTEI